MRSWCVVDLCCVVLEGCQGLHDSDDYAPRDDLLPRNLIIGVRCTVARRARVGIIFERVEK